MTICFVKFSFSQEEKRSKILNFIIENENLEKNKIESRFVRLKKKPVLKNEMIVVIPIITFENLEEIEKNYQMHIYIVDNKQLLIKSKLILEESVSSDQIIFLEEVEIDTAKYYLNYNTRAFGLKLTFAGGGSVDYVRYSELSLFIEKSKTLKEILKGVKTQYDITSTSGSCEYAKCFDTKSVLLLTDNFTSNYKNIKIISQETEYELNDDCETKINIRKKSKTHKTLKFNKKIKKYVL